MLWSPSRIRRACASRWSGPSTRPSPATATTALETRAVERFPLSDQEVLVRHFHEVVGDWVDDYLRATVGVGA